MPPPPPPPPMRFTFLQFSLRGRLCGRASAGPAPPRPGIKMAWCWPFHRFQELHGRSVVAHILDPSRPPPSPELRLGSALEELRGPAARAVSAEALSEYLPAVRRLVCQARFHGSVYRDTYIHTYRSEEISVLGTGEAQGGSVSRRASVGGERGLVGVRGY